MRVSQSCSRGVRAEATVDYFGEGGRIKGSVLYIASQPDRLRFDVFSPFGVILSTLTSDGTDFSLWDIKEKRFFYGPARTCNLSRFTKVPVPAFAMVQLLRGEAPVLVHEPGTARIAWEGGEYVIRVDSKHQASQTIALMPRDEDWLLPYSEQRLRVTGVHVSQQGIDLYDAELSDYRLAHTAPPYRDAEGLEADVPPSGPPCEAELPHRVRIEVEEADHDLIFYNKEVAHNPPLLQGVFRQAPPRGARAQRLYCSD